MKKAFVIIILIMLTNILLSLKTEAQTNELDNIYTKEHVVNNKPIPYVFVREADVYWSTRIWRIIDLRERMNLPLYYPTTTMDDRYSLINLLLHGIRYEGLPAYSTKDDEFKVQIGVDDILVAMGASADTSEVMNVETGMMEMRVIQQDVRSDDVKQIMVKELWFFDRNYSRLDVRIIGLCPILETVGDDGNVTKKQTFWINYNEARPLFARHETFIQGNDAQRRSFDDLFLKRYFGSYVVKQSNVYNNRQISDYAVGVEAMLESERIKYEIFRMEHDMWEF
ncbi:MAG: gliding motility protein GldN [Marinilabiliaceae bacterium]|nr:gliding motility protein GldN [Marinilabiliaceae bacterium]